MTGETSIHSQNTYWHFHLLRDLLLKVQNRSYVDPGFAREEKEF